MDEVDRKNLRRGGQYCKINDQTRPDFEEYGMRPFRPSDKQTLKSYYEVPPDVLENEEELISWARKAIQVTRSQK